MRKQVKSIWPDESLRDMSSNFDTASALLTVTQWFDLTRSTPGALALTASATANPFSNYLDEGTIFA
jgi:hypothetical protein